ncbi:MAG: NTP transferase domain-containing protein, partial [Burkholderiales bacterium]|nr:NTP transferase domain-containing protein [Burkholderiales bacterium]
MTDPAAETAASRPLPTCIILAGGLGTRLRGVVGSLPKCLAPVGARPFLAIQLDTLFAAGVGEVVLSLGHGAQQVVDAVQALGSAGAQRPIRWVVEPELLGTGGAIAHVLEALALDEAWVANGDTYLDGDLSALHPPLDRAGGERLRMALVQVQDRGRFGGVQVDGQGRVSGFLEKGRHDAGLINAGLYRLSRAALPAARRGA